MRLSRRSRGSSRGAERSGTGFSPVEEALKNARRYRLLTQAPLLSAQPAPAPYLVALRRPRLAPVEFEHDGGQPSARPAYVQAQVAIGARDQVGNRVGAWRIGWNGRMLTFGSATTVVGEWRRRGGGVLPECRGEDAGAARIDVGSDAVAEIAAVSNDQHVFWLLLLNERAQSLASLQVIGFDEPRLVEFADAAGLHYRRYRLSDHDSWGMATYFPSRYRDAVVFTLSVTFHVVKRQDWIRPEARTQSEG